MMNVCGMAEMNDYGCMCNVLKDGMYVSDN